MQRLLATKKTIALIVTILLIAPFTALPALAQPGGSGLNIPITGTFTEALGGTGTFAGNFDLQRFAVRNG
jgi:hypothetical protein